MPAPPMPTKCSRLPVHGLSLMRRRPYARPRRVRGASILAPVDHGSPISYMALEEGADVMTSDGERIGTVKHVLADEDNDIFDGLVVETDNGNRFVDAPEVEEIYE